MNARLTAAIALALLAGCGGEPGPALAPDTGARLAASADRVATAAAAGDDCGAVRAAERLQSQAIAAVNAGEVPSELQEELLAGVNRVGASLACVPPPPPPPPPPPLPPSDGGNEEDD